MVRLADGQTLDLISRLPDITLGKERLIIPFSHSATEAPSNENK